MAHDLTITDTLPGNVNFGGTVNNAGFVSSTTATTLSYFTPTLGINEVRNILYTVTVDAPTIIDITNTVAVTTITPPVDTSTLTDVLVVPLMPPELHITKLVTTPDPIPTGFLTYTLIISNTGGSNATQVAVSDTLPIGLNYLAGTLAVAPATGGTAGTFPWIATGGLITQGEQITVTFAVTVDEALAGQIVTNRATVTSFKLSTVNPNQTNEIGILIEPPALRIDKSATPDPVEASDILTYQIVVDNLGKGPAFNVVITDVLPSNVTFNQIISDAGFTAVTTTPGIVTFLTDTVLAQSTHTFTFDVLVDAATIIDIVNQAEITSTTYISGNGPLSTEVTTTLAPPALAINKFVQPTPVEIGDMLTYTIVISNVGGSNATDVTVQDILPANLTFIGPITFTGVPTGTAGITTTSPTIVSGATITKDNALVIIIPMQANMGLPNGTVVQNTATVTSSKFPTPQSDSVPATLLAPSIEVSKTADVAVVMVNNSVLYSYTITNTGGVSLSNIVVVDIPLGPVTIGSTTLAPGEVTTGSLTYGPVTPADFTSNNPLINDVIVTGTSPIGTIVTDTERAVVEVDMIFGTPTFTPIPTATPTPTPTPTPSGLVYLHPSVVTVPEGVGSTTLTLHLDTAQSVPVHVTLNTLIQFPDYAISGLDYGVINQTITFQPGETAKDFNIIINQDGLLEPNEQFLVIIDSVVGGGVAAWVGRDETLVTILDDDPDGPTPTPTVTETPITETPTPTSTATPTMTPTSATVPTSAVTPTSTQPNPATATLTLVATETVQPTSTQVNQPGNTPIPTSTSTPSATLTSASPVTSIPSATPVPLDTAVPSMTPVPSVTAVSVATATPTETTVSSVATATPTNSATLLPGDTAQPSTPTVTSVVVATATPTETVFTATLQPTATQVPGSTPELGPLDTNTPTATMTATATATITLDPSVTPSSTTTLSTPPAAPTDSTPTHTATAMPTMTATATLPPGMTPMPVPTATDTSTPAPAPRLELSLVIDPNSLDAQGMVSPGSQVTFILVVLNPSEATVFDAQLVVTVPEYTTFNQAFSDPRWALFAGLLNAAEDDPCPDGHEAGKQCVLPLGDLVAGSSVNGLRFTVVIDEDIPVGSETTLRFPAQLIGAGLDNGDLNVSLDAGANVAINMTADPTSLNEDGEPLSRKLYLPIISR